MFSFGQKYVTVCTSKNAPYTHKKISICTSIFIVSLSNLDLNVKFSLKSEDQNAFFANCLWEGINLIFLLFLPQSH